MGEDRKNKGLVSRSQIINKKNAFLHPQKERITTLGGTSASRAKKEQRECVARGPRNGIAQKA